jgi:hypothetical protein
VPYGRRTGDGPTGICARSGHAADQAQAPLEDPALALLALVVTQQQLSAGLLRAPESKGVVETLVGYAKRDLAVWLEELSADPADLAGLNLRAAA